MQSYVRVIAAEPSDHEAQDLQRVLERLAESFPHVSIESQLSPHPKGGFSFSLDISEDDRQGVINFLAEAGWRLCV